MNCVIYSFYEHRTTFKRNKVFLSIFGFNFLWLVTFITFNYIFLLYNERWTDMHSYLFYLVATIVNNLVLSSLHEKQKHTTDGQRLLI